MVETGRDGVGAGRTGYRLRLKPGRERSVLQRHPWLFSGAVAEVEALHGAVPGDLGDVVDTSGRFLARGTVQPDSQILCRILTWRDEPVDAAFFHRRVERAAAMRAELVADAETTAWRVINSEGDELPGLVVDIYGDILVAQVLTAGMSRHSNLWLDALESIFSPVAILERGERARRESVAEEGTGSRLLRGSLKPGPCLIHEHGLVYEMDPEVGQKTGFYLDQRDNRRAVRMHAGGRRVLNLFGYTGAFSVSAGAGGAGHVVHVESSAPARELARRNWAHNGLPKERFETSGEDAFRFLRNVRESYDLIVLDPPPFARDRRSLDRALRAYKDLNLWVLCRAKPGALVWSFSCSQHVSHDLFQKVVFGASLDARASVQWLGRCGAACDHPVHLDHPQGEYLNGLWMRVLEPGRPPSVEAEG